jgi:oxygen-independent coproporphyrinogen-3 oxidase
VPADETVVRQFDLLLDWVEDSAYQQYEISNFSFPGQEAIHNSQYWTGVPYLGIGPSAHSFDGYQRHWNVANNATYMKSIENGQLPKQTEPFRQLDRINERIMTALRLRSGLKWSEFQKDFGDYEVELKKRVANHPMSEWWMWDEDAVKLSRQGMHYADRAAADLFFD